MGYNAGAAFLHRQAWQDAVQLLELAPLVDGQNYGMGRRVYIETDNVVHFDRELRVIRELERSEAVRLKPAQAPDLLNVGEVHARDLRHRAAGPVGRCTWRFSERQSAEGLDRRRPGLVQQQAIGASLSKPFLPAPDSRLAFGGPAHDRHRVESAGGSGQHERGAPDVLLRGIAICRDGFEPVMLSDGYFEDDSGAHRINLHAENSRGIHLRTRPLGSFHKKT